MTCGEPASPESDEGRDQQKDMVPQRWSSDCKSGALTAHLHDDPQLIP